MENNNKKLSIEETFDKLFVVKEGCVTFTLNKEDFDNDSNLR